MDHISRTGISDRYTFALPESMNSPEGMSTVARVV